MRNTTAVKICVGWFRKKCSYFHSAIQAELMSNREALTYSLSERRGRPTLWITAGCQTGSDNRTAEAELSGMKQGKGFEADQLNKNLREVKLRKKIMKKSY